MLLLKLIGRQVKIDGLDLNIDRSVIYLMLDEVQIERYLPFLLSAREGSLEAKVYRRRKERKKINGIKTAFNPIVYSDKDFNVIHIDR